MKICAYMKEIGLSENLKTVGVFNFNADSKNLLNHQLMAQMLWYLIEGINVQRTHPKERSYDTFVVLIDNRDFSFKGILSADCGICEGKRCEKMDSLFP